MLIECGKGRQTAKGLLKRGTKIKYTELVTQISNKLLKRPTEKRQLIMLGVSSGGGFIFGSANRE